MISIIKLVNQFNIVIIPFGGGTSVSGAVSCPENEKRCIVSVDTSQMVIFIGIFSNIKCTYDTKAGGRHRQHRPRAAFKKYVYYSR